MKKKNYIEQYLNELADKEYFEVIGDGVSIQDTNYKILYQNSTHKSFIGEHIGEYCYQAYENRESICEGCPLTMSFKDGLPHTAERTAPIAGEISYFEITASTLKDNSGTIIAGIEVVRDISDRKRYEESVKESEEKYRLLFSTEKDAVIMVDAETMRIIDVNDSALKLYGYNKEEILKLSGLDLSAEPEKSEDAIKEISTVTDKRVHYHTRYHKKKDGTVFPVEISSSSFMLKNKKVVSAMMRDISERKRVEKELRQYEHIVSSSTDMLALLDNRYVYLATNSSYRAAFNMAPDQLIGNTVSQVFGEKFFKTVIKPHADRCLSGEEIKYQEWFDFPATGTRYMSINYYPYLNDKNEVIGFVVNARDITERKQIQIAQLALKSNLESLWNLVKLQDKDLKTVADFVLDEISRMSRSKYGFYGFMSKDESIMHVYAWSKKVMKDCAIHHEHLRFEIKKAGIWGDAVRKRKNILINNYSDSFDGKKGIPEGHVSLSRILSVPVFSHNKIVAVAAVANKDSDYTADDVEQLTSFLTSAHLIIQRMQVETERELLHKELKMKNKELEQVLYITSHDLRSPLVNVEGFGAELEYSLNDLMSYIDHADVPASIKDKITPIVKEDIPESLHYIQTSVSKMHTLLKGILTLSRLGRSELAIAEIDMNEMMTEIVDNNRFSLNELSIMTKDSNLPNCKGDISEINQVFSNLLDNAIKYTDPERPGVIKISGYKDKNYSVYCIEDNGIGIAPEHQDKIFEIFHQLEPNRVKGEGMGLTIIHRIIEKHNGKIWVESELGKGSKFFVSLPS